MILGWDGITSWSHNDRPFNEQQNEDGEMDGGLDHGLSLHNSGDERVETYGGADRLPITDHDIPP